ncbi:MAG TPA: ferritin-like domain-containing protein [Firmicutes bacterium]|jgi:bacterioferritin|nr:ferritin-like domain-containing protein [Bacillota bacterium]
MEREDLLFKLNWFYSLEVSQVDLYLAQSKRFKGTYESIVFARTAAVEQQHVEKLAVIIRELGGEPHQIGDVISPLFGGLLGKTLAFTGLKNTLQGNITIENKAMTDYVALLQRVGAEFGPELQTILQHNLVDEDVHTAWFVQRLADYELLELLKRSD